MAPRARPRARARRPPAAPLPALLLLLALACGAAPPAAEAADASPPPTTKEYPPLDGRGNNKANPTWGTANSPLLRHQVPEAAYGSKDDAMPANRPDPREVSMALSNDPYFKAASKYNTSYMLSALGQLIAMDTSAIQRRPDGGSAPMAVPPGDPLFSLFTANQTPSGGGRRTLNFNRTGFVRDPAGGPRQQLNTETAFLDASTLYGTTAKAAANMRAGTGGLLKDDGQHNLPLNLDRRTGQPIDPDVSNAAGVVPLTQLRLAGNPNVNQNPFPLILHTLLLREHNRRAVAIWEQHRDWTDEQVFQEARKWVVAHFQQVALGEYLSGLGIPLPPYTGYNASINPGIDNFFTTAAYRYGHATITDVLLRLDERWGEHPMGHLPLSRAYYNAPAVLEAGVEPLIRGLVAMPQGQVEARWSRAVSGELFGPPAINGSDLAAINIQRGRDHGIPDYNTCRRLMGLPPVKSFAELTPDAALASKLKSLYGTIDVLDAYVGGLAEPHYAQSHVGPLFYASIRDQFLRLRDGDRFYFDNPDSGLFNETERQEIRTTGLRDLIIRNTDIPEDGLPNNIWLATGVGASGGLPGSCAAAGGAGAGAEADRLVLPGLLQGEAEVQVERSDTPGWVRVAVSAVGAGWLGFAVADPDSAAPMIGADMVVGRMSGGRADVGRYTATAHEPPRRVADAGRLRAVSFEQADNRVRLVFERPLDGGAGGGDDGRAMPQQGPLRVLVARNPSSNELSSTSDYHGPSNREFRDVSRLFGGAAGGAALGPSAPPATRVATRRRRAHGALMATNFVLVMPLGALAARQLRSHWLRSPAVRASLFYVHIATQLTGVVIATAGFAIATHLFGVPVGQVSYSHGKLGTAILALVWSQMIVGFLRPTASAPTRRRHVWDLVHTLLGRCAMLLGVVNVALGIFIFTTQYAGRFSLWAGLCATSLGAITLLQYYLDRQEKFAVLRSDQASLGGPAAAAAAAAAARNGARGGKDAEPDPSAHSGALGDDDLAAFREGGGGRGGSSAGGGSPRAGAAGGRLTESMLRRHHAASAAGDSGNGGANGGGAAADFVARHGAAADAPPPPPLHHHGLHPQAGEAPLGPPPQAQPWLHSGGGAGAGHRDGGFGFPQLGGAQGGPQPGGGAA